MNVARLIVLALTLLAVPLPALAQNEPTKPAEPLAKASEVPKKVCRRVMTTGSIMSNRVCMTAELWTEIDKQRSENSENALSRRGAMGAGSSMN